MRLYLSGGMEFKESLGKHWREDLTKRLAEIGHGVFDPVSKESEDDLASSYDWKEKKLSDTENYRHMVREYMFRVDMIGIKESDVVVLLYDESVQKGAGSLAEAWEAFREGKPLYIVSDFDLKDIPGWLVGESTEIFQNFDDFLRYISDESLLAFDISEAITIRNKYLNGIYK